MQTSTYYEDNYSPQEMEEQFEYGETAYCEVTSHFDWSDNVHGFPTLIPGRDWVSCCEDCGPTFAEEIVQEALRAGLGCAVIYERVKAHFEVNDYSEALANQIVAALREELAGAASLAALDSEAPSSGDIPGRWPRQRHPRSAAPRVTYNSTASVEAVETSACTSTAGLS